MRRSFRFGLVALVAVASVLVFVGTRDTSLAESGAQRNIVMMRCDIGSSGFRVTSYSKSSSGPSKTSDNCAELLSTLHRDGFSPIDIGYVDAGDGYVVYTLGR